MKLLNRLFISLCECMTGKSSAFLLGAGVFLYAMPPLTLAQNTPLFTPSFTGNALVDTSLSQGYYAPNLSFPSDQPVQITGPAEVTNATQIYVLFLSDSLGHTNLSDATANTGFQLAGVGSASISGIVDPPTNPNPSNYYYSAVGPDIENQAWMLINFTPGTNNSIVTNNLQVIAVNGNNNQTANWVLTNLNLVVRPPQQPPPVLGSSLLQQQHKPV